MDGRMGFGFEVHGVLHCTSARLTMNLTEFGIDLNRQDASTRDNNVKGILK